MRAIAVTPTMRRSSMSPISVGVNRSKEEQNQRSTLRRFAKSFLQVLVVATGEEKGTSRSDYLVHVPTCHGAAIAANITPRVRCQIGHT
jgi:hypothetical protein